MLKTRVFIGDWKGKRQTGYLFASTASTYETSLLEVNLSNGIMPSLFFKNGEVVICLCFAFSNRFLNFLTAVLTLVYWKSVSIKLYMV